VHGRVLYGNWSILAEDSSVRAPLVPVNHSFGRERCKRRDCRRQWLVHWNGSRHSQHVSSTEADAQFRWSTCAFHRIPRRTVVAVNPHHVVLASLSRAIIYQKHGMKENRTSGVLLFSPSQVPLFVSPSIGFQGSLSVTDTDSVIRASTVHCIA
jgi:hypothetical protein